jgi:hypothetical protein
MNSIFFLLILSLVLPLQAGIMARSFGRNFWLWFFVTLPLPVIANYILLCLGDKPEIKFTEQIKEVNRLVTVKRTGQFSPKPIQLVVNG